MKIFNIIKCALYATYPIIIFVLYLIGAGYMTKYHPLADGMIPTFLLWVVIAPAGLFAAILLIFVMWDALKSFIIHRWIKYGEKYEN